MVDRLTAVWMTTGQFSIRTTFPCWLRARDLHPQILDRQHRLDGASHLLLCDRGGLEMSAALLGHLLAPSLWLANRRLLEVVVSVALLLILGILSSISAS